MNSYENEQKYNFIERIMLQHSYPPKLISASLGILFGSYFLWHQKLLIALILIFGLSILWNVIAWNRDIQQLSKTSLGKWMLVQAKPDNLIIPFIGVVVLFYGIWFHAAIVIGLGLCIIFLTRLLSTKKLKLQR